MKSVALSQINLLVLSLKAKCLLEDLIIKQTELGKSFSLYKKNRYLELLLSKKSALLIKKFYKKRFKFTKIEIRDEESKFPLCTNEFSKNIVEFFYYFMKGQVSPSSAKSALTKIKSAFCLREKVSLNISKCGKTHLNITKNAFSEISIYNFRSHVNFKTSRSHLLWSLIMSCLKQKNDLSKIDISNLKSFSMKLNSVDIFVSMLWIEFGNNFNRSSCVQSLTLVSKIFTAAFDTKVSFKVSNVTMVIELIESKPYLRFFKFSMPL